MKQIPVPNAEGGPMTGLLADTCDIFSIRPELRPCVLSVNRLRGVAGSLDGRRRQKSIHDRRAGVNQ
jgi:hypothetical protein